jgi:TrmH family RNA methyltransferase
VTAVATPFTPLTSRQHPVVQACRDLASARGAGRTVLLDGAHLIAEAFRNGVPIDSVLAGARFLEESGHDGRTLLGRIQQAGGTVFDASDGVIAAASPVRTPSGIVAIARWSPAPIADVFGPPARPAPSGVEGSGVEASLAVGLYGVQDPGNLGAAIRSADALGATGVVSIGHAADPAGWKALRGAMGSTFRLPVSRASLEDVLAAAREQRTTVFAATARGGVALPDASLAAPVLLLFGGEGAGLPDAAIPDYAMRLTIPMRAGVESLNVAVAVGLVLYEARRQRQAMGS